MDCVPFRSAIVQCNCIDKRGVNHDCHSNSCYARVGSPSFELCLYRYTISIKNTALLIF